MKKVIDSRVFKGVVVQLKFGTSNGYYGVIGGETKFPKKEHGVTDEKSARAWLNLLCRELGLLSR